MEFKDIKFIERPGAKASGLWLVLPGGWWVHKSAVEVAWNKARTILPTLDRRLVITIEMLHGSELFRSKKLGTRHAIGRCIKYFFAHGMLPRKGNPVVSKFALISYGSARG